MIPQDIEQYIEQNFMPHEHGSIIKIVDEIFQKDWNVGPDQLVRSLLVLSNKNYQNLVSLLNFEDPRDIIMDAERKAGNPGHYYNIPFSEMR